MRPLVAPRGSHCLQAPDVALTHGRRPLATIDLMNRTPGSIALTNHLTRRRLLLLGLTLPVPVLVAACSGSESDPGPTPGTGRSLDAAPTSAPSGATSTQPTAASPTAAPAASISCSGVATPAQTEGPYFKAGSPPRTSLVEGGVVGTPLTLTGYVLNRSCLPIGNVKLDFWQADGNGNYDNSGYRLRGYQFTDSQGRYRLETVIPGLYPGRTEHIHFKAQAPGKPELTSQLYFPGVAQNRSDGIFDAALLIDLKDSPNGTKLGAYNIILDV